MTTYFPLVPWLLAGLAILLIFGGGAYVVFYLASMLAMAYRFHLRSAYERLLETGPHPLSEAAARWTAPEPEAIDHARHERAMLERLVFAMLVGGLVLGIVGQASLVHGGMQALFNRQEACTSAWGIHSALFEQMKIPVPEPLRPALQSRPIDPMLEGLRQAWLPIVLGLVSLLATGFFDVWASTAEHPGGAALATRWRRRTTVAFLGMVVLAVAHYMGLFNRLEEIIVYGIGYGILLIIMIRTW